MTTDWRWLSIYAGCSRSFRARAFEICGDNADARRGLRGRDLEDGMKSRLSSTIWTLVLLNGVVGFIVIGLAFSAGKKAGETSLFAFGSPAGGTVRVAIVLAVARAAVLAWRFGAMLGPVQALAEFSERFAAGDPRARAEVNSNDELGYIAENLNRAVAKVSKATTNQDANDALQRSITELLSVINQVARGDLSQRGKVTSDALGNVTDSINYMLDNFTKVLERVRKAAMEVTACSNNILVAADEMQAGATQQDQEITNTSSAVEELTVSMKQVSNNAEASAEAARRALDAAEQGNRAVRHTLEGMQGMRAWDAISSVVRQSAELVQEISLASKQQVRGTEGVAHAMQIISNITRQTSQGTRGTVATVSQLVKLSDQLNEALAQFRTLSKPSSGAVEESERPIPVGAHR